MNDREIYDASNEQHVAKKADKLKAKRIQELDDIRSILNTSEGRRFIWRLLGICGIYHDDFCSNALTMSNLAGQRKVGLILLGELKEADVKAYIRMQSDALSEEALNG